MIYIGELTSLGNRTVALPSYRRSLDLTLALNIVHLFLRFLFRISILLRIVPTLRGSGKRVRILIHGNRLGQRIIIRGLILFGDVAVIAVSSVSTRLRSGVLTRG